MDINNRLFHRGIIKVAFFSSIYEEASTIGQSEVSAISGATQAGHYYWYLFSFLLNPIIILPEGVV